MKAVQSTSANEGDSAELLFQFDQIVAGYADTTVLRGVSGSLQRGQVLAVLGRNGVGKTTLLRALSGFLPLMQGRIAYAGRDLAHVPPYERLATGIAYSPQEDTVFTELSVGENLRLHLSTSSLERYQKYFEAFPRLRERLAQRAGSLSGGERKLLAFTRTLALNAPLSLIDEPTEGVQPENIDRMARLIQARRAEGAAFVVVEQNLSFVFDVADHILLLDHGEMVLAGRSSDFTRGDLEEKLAV